MLCHAISEMRRRLGGRSYCMFVVGQHGGGSTAAPRLIVSSSWPHHGSPWHLSVTVWRRLPTVGRGVVAIHFEGRSADQWAADLEHDPEAVVQSLVGHLRTVHGLGPADIPVIHADRDLSWE